MSDLIIYKYSIGRPAEFNTLKLPINSKILSVGVQEGMVVMWVSCQPSIATEERTFVYWPTGEILPDCELEYIDTVQDKMPRNPLLPELVWHIFEVKAPL